MTEEIEIKDEFDKLQCRTCLSIGRKLLPMGKYANVYRQLTSEYAFHAPQCTEQLLVCWECRAMLHRALQFQCRVVKANEMLQTRQIYIYGTISNLATVVLNDTHHTIYINQANIITDKKTHEEFRETVVPSNTLSPTEQNGTKTEMDDKTEENDFTDDESTLNYNDIKKIVKLELKSEKESTEANKKVKINRWAMKRALQNKKPKFKIVSSKDGYRKVKINETDVHICIEKERESESYKNKRYKCKKCVIGFNKEYLFLKHNRREHENLGHYICDLCGRRSSSKRHLSAHIKEHYYMYECLLCDVTCYRKREIDIHLKNVHKKVFQCLKCGVKVESRREFFKHFKQWHERFVCDHCGVGFKMRYCIKDHIRKQHSPFECKLCEKRFARYNGLWLHNKTRHATAAAPAYCVECDRRYPDVYRYRWHLANSKRHSPKKPARVPCPDCDKIFTKNIYMKDHYNLVHLKHFKYRCEECDKNFIRNADLVKHRRRVHEGILPPKDKICITCGRGFTTNKILSNHMRTHTGERPHACARCRAAFAQRAALAAHARVCSGTHARARC